MIAAVAAAVSLPLAIYILISGLDDGWMDLLWLYRLLRRREPEPPPPARPQRIAILIPCWHEQDVIESMVERNCSSIRYPSYEIFIGAYRNDPATQEAVERLSSRYRHVHLIVVPHNGPTVKADCLNWVYQGILAREEDTDKQFELFVLHDAEDLIHPQELAEMDLWSHDYDMIQSPVLPLPTPLRSWTHGVYCDDFAEGQLKDLETRVASGGFLPGCGVGTAITREALDTLAWMSANRVFSPDHLTEDYDLGLRLHELGCPQLFLPLRRHAGTWLATREYFPQEAAAAVRQRSRWITGNSLQSWERAGWRGGWRQKYFFWRDRKGLWGNPLSLVANLLLVYGVLSWLSSHACGYAWPLREQLNHTRGIVGLLGFNFALLCGRMAVRCSVVGRVYGWRFALGVPPRMFWGNWINTRATLRALRTFWSARLRGEPLVWCKTEHLYPTRSGWMPERPLLGEILVGGSYLSQQQVDRALATQPPARLFGEWLVELGLLTEKEVYEALSLQQGIPRAHVRPHEVTPQVARALPRHVLRRWRVLPYRIAQGGLYVASADPPTEQMRLALGDFTRLEIRLHLLTPEEFDELSPRWR